MEVHWKESLDQKPDGPLSCRAIYAHVIVNLYMCIIVIYTHVIIHIYIYICMHTHLYLHVYTGVICQIERIIHYLAHIIYIHIIAVCIHVYIHMFYVCLTSKRSLKPSLRTAPLQQPTGRGQEIWDRFVDERNLIVPRRLSTPYVRSMYII